MKGINSYFDYAENDYWYLEKYYQIYCNEKENIEPPNAFCANCQNTCEKFLIDEYTNKMNKERQLVLKTRSINKLISYLKSNNIEINYNSFKNINSYYFEVRYPGENSYFVTDEDITYCWEQLEQCRNEVIAYMETC